MKKAVLTLAAVRALVLTAFALGDEFSQGKGAKAAPNWKVLGLGPGGSWHSEPAKSFADGIGFAFGTDNPQAYTLNSPTAAPAAAPRREPPTRQGSGVRTCHSWR